MVLHLTLRVGYDIRRVRDAVITHPTMGEGLNLLFDAMADG